MVAEFRERSRKILATTLLALVLASTLPSTLAQSLPTTPDGATGQGFELSVKQGEAVISAANTENPPNLKFVQGNRSYYLRFPVYNSGAEASPSGLPVYVWFKENMTGQAIYCRTLPSVSAADATTKGKVMMTMLLELPNDVVVPPGEAAPTGTWTNGYNITVLVNREPVGLPAYESRIAANPAHFQSNCPLRPQFTAASDPIAATTAARDVNAINNVLTAHIVKDAKLDLRVSSVKWCIGEAHLAAGYDPSTDAYDPAKIKLCDVNPGPDPHNHRLYTSDMSGAGNGLVFNTTRKHEQSFCNVRTGCDAYYNVSNATYFEIRVENTPEATWNFTEDLGAACAGSVVTPDPSTNPNARWYNVTPVNCPGYQLDVDLRISNLTEDVRASNVVLTNRSQVTRGWGDANPHRSVTWHLINWTGPFKLYATVNDQGRIPEVVSTNNDLIIPDPNPPVDAPPEYPFEVAWADLEPTILPAGLKTSPTDPYPYRQQASITITGAAYVRNLGPGVPALIRWESSPGGPVRYTEKVIAATVQLDNRTSVTHTSAHLVSGIGNASTPEDKWWRIPFTFENTTNPGDSNYIAPGKHSVCVTVDPGNSARELNETNNKHCVAIYLQDVRAPAFAEIEGRVSPRVTDTPAYNGTILTSIYPGDAIFVHSNATDDDLGSLNVTAQFTLNTNASVVRNYTMARNPQFQDGTFSVRILDFDFHGENDTTENWTLRVLAKDAFGNEALSQPTTLLLKRWPVQTHNASYIVPGIPRNSQDEYYPDGHVFNYSDDIAISYHLFVLENMTGIVNQPNVTDNLAMRVFTPRNTTFYVNGSGFEKLADCPQDELPVGGQRGPRVCSNVGLFNSPYVVKSEGGPGRWYVHFEITDRGGDVRVVNRTFVLRDQLPTLWNQSLSHAELEAGQALLVRVNMTDDFAIDMENGGAMVNFTRRTDNKTFSVPLTGKPAFVEGGRATYAFNNTIETGYGKKLDEAGEYDVRFVARDNQGNWNQTPPIPFKLNDTRAPDLHEAEADQQLQEVGQDVRFTARVTDQTNVTVKLRIRPAGSDEDIVNVNMTPNAPGSQNFTYVVNITREGNYVWEIFARDSAGLVSSVRSGPLGIADNLGPRFQIVEPGLLVEGKRYARAAPQIGLIVTDTHGVDRDSIEIHIGGQLVSHDTPVPATGGLNGYVVNYTVPASQRFAHRDVVTVNVTAIDLSGRQLTGWLNFTFTVDDQPPTVRVREFSPRFPTDGTGTVNVSLRTRFTLDATDEDGLPTGVESIRYRIFGGGNNAAETVYGEPFTIGDAPGVYTGPKIYQIQYWAVDAVGNQRMVAGRPTYETLTVYVDDIPPALDPFGSLPQGRFVNATFIDDRSGVDRAVVWYSVNGAPYVPLPLDFVAGVWSAVLPEGKKGERIAYYLEAFDRVENRETFGNATEPYASYIVGNHAPSIRVTAPAEGSRVARTIDLAWVASDEDGDPLVFTVFVKAPGTTTFTELARLESNDARRYAIDTTRYTDGQYTFRVTVSDGSFVSLGDTTVSILNRASAFGSVPPPPSGAQVGSPVVLQVEVTKAEAQVEARVYRDGELVQSFAMNDEGRDGDAVARDGRYSARVLLDDGGTYSVEFHAVYQEDGVRKEATIQGGELVVEGGGLSLPWILAGLGLLVVAGLVVAAVVIVRGRKGQ